MSESGSTEGTDYTESTAGETPAGEGEDGEQGPKNPEEEEDKPEPEPEPEPDPLEGIAYEDDPELTLPPYGNVEYWESRYTDDPAVFEWYQDPDALLPTIKKYVDGEGRLIVIGTGNSDLAPFLNQNGFESVTAIDFAKPCIVKSRRRNAELEGLVWKVMDVRKMTFPDGDFQAVIDKGTLDSIFFAGEPEVISALSEISRVLKKRGVYICLSCAPPEARKPYFNRPAQLQFELETIVELKMPLPSDDPHYLYVVRKGGKVLT
jgi:SAM-dependent methyltransferase